MPRFLGEALKLPLARIYQKLHNIEKEEETRKYVESSEKAFLTSLRQPAHRRG